ncbi:MAG: hypothetical protein ACYTEU_13300 [Planctomycetota bacterium]|jgi:hypothetical protein
MVIRGVQCISVLFLLSIVHFIWLSFAKPQIRIDYAERIAQLSQPVPDKGKNAAMWYQQAIEAYHKPEALFGKEIATEIHKLLYTKDLYRKIETNSLTEDQLQRLGLWCEANEKSIFNLLKGTEQPYCFWDYGFESTLYANAKTPDCLVLTEILRLLIWQAHKNTSEGDYEKAFSKLLCVYRLGRHFKGPKTLFEQYYGHYIQSLAVGIIRHIASGHDVSEKDISHLRVELLRLYTNDIFVMNILTEKFAILDLIQRTYTEDEYGQGVLIPRELKKINKLTNFTDILEMPVLSEGLSYGASIASVNRKELTEEVEVLYEESVDYIGFTPYERNELKLEDPFEKRWGDSKVYRFRYWPLCFWGNYSGHAEKISQVKCEIQATLTILSLLEYKNQMGSYPETLDLLVEKRLLPELSSDPYSNNSLVYRKVDDEFVLYSVSLNFSDDGGVLGTCKKNKKPWADNADAVFWPVGEEE